VNVGAIRPASTTWRLLALFLLALVTRLVYNLYIALHRMPDVGDSFYYLTAGRSLATLVRESQSILIFLSHLCAAAHFDPDRCNSFSSVGLSYSLLTDGLRYRMVGRIFVMIDFPVLPASQRGCC